MATIFAANRGAKGPKVGDVKTKLKQWYWCSVFAQMYESNPTSQSMIDILEFQAWLDGGPAPQTVANFQFKPESLYTVTTRQRAIYRGVLCLVLRRPPLDIHSTKKLTASLVVHGHVDDHHIFPAAYLASVCPGLDAREIDSILNRTLMDRVTNQSIGKRPPSDYLQDIESNMGAKALDEVLESHCLPTGPASSLRRNEYDEFRKERAEVLSKLIWDATTSKAASATHGF